MTSNNLENEKKTNISVFFLLTMQCNLNCPYCIRMVDSQKIDQINVSYSNATKILNQLTSSNNHYSLILTGGEPTLHPQFLDILQYCINSFKSFTLATNGQISHELLTKILSADKDKHIVFSISLDGNQEIHDKIRGRGTFNKTLETIEYILKTGHKVSVESTVSKRNYKSMKDLSLILCNYPISSWNISIEHAYTESEFKFQLTYEEWNTFVDEIISFSKQRLQIKKIYDFKLYEKIEKKFGKEFLAENVITNCGYCKNKLFIYPDCSVRACTCMNNTLLGNLNNEDLDSIQGKMKILKESYHLKPNSPCTECRWKYICNGGCLGYSYYFMGDIGYGDIRCPMVKEAYGI